MKINVVGDVLTMPYSLAKSLKKKNVEIKLFLNSFHIDESYNPVWEDSHLDKTGLPDWIETQDVSLLKLCLRKKNERQFLRRLADCDLIHALGESCIWASFTDKPYVFQSYGFDLDYMPFNKGTLKLKILSHLLRRGIRNASQILVSPYQRTSLEKLGISDSQFSYHYWGIDTNKYKKIDSSLGKEIRDKFKVDLIFFHPTRHEWGSSKKIDKGNDKLLLAFSNYLKNTEKKALLILIEKGNDASKSKSIINELGLNKNVLWIKQIDKKELIEYYSISDLVFDQFSVGGFGQIFLESMAVGVPTVTYFKGYEKLYTELPPAINVFSSKEIFAQMVKLSNDPEKRREIGNRSREWMLKYLDWDVISDKYLNCYQEILCTKPDKRIP